MKVSPETTAEVIGVGPRGFLADGAGQAPPARPELVQLAEVGEAGLGAAGVPSSVAGARDWVGAACVLAADFAADD